jgi:hypothetical protein
VREAWGTAHPSAISNTASWTVSVRMSPMRARLRSMSSMTSASFLTRRTHIVSASSRNLLTRCLVVCPAITPAISSSGDALRILHVCHEQSRCPFGRLPDDILWVTEGFSCIAGLPGIVSYLDVVRRHVARFAVLDYDWLPHWNLDPSLPCPIPTAPYRSSVPSVTTWAAGLW